MKKDKVIKFRVPIYNCDVIYVVSDDFLRAGRYLRTELQLDSNENNGIAVESGGRTSTFILMVKHKYKKDWSIIAHEAFHIANYILSSRGVKCSLNNDEAQAYLLSYIIKKIQKK